MLLARRCPSPTEASQTAQRHGMQTEFLVAVAMKTLKVLTVLVERALSGWILIRVTPHCKLVPTMDSAITQKATVNALQAGAAAMAVDTCVMIAVLDQI